MNWRIREAGLADVDRLALIGSATFLETFAGVLDGDGLVAHCRREHTAAAYEACLKRGAWAWLAQVDPGGAPVGFALLAPADLPGAREGDLELKHIYTLSRFHGAGLGGELMGRAVGRALDQRARRLLLGVYAGNARAIAFYGKFGFTPVGSRRFDVGGHGYDDVVLAKPLA